MFDLVKLYSCEVKGKQCYFIDNTKPYDDETWYQRIEWDKETNIVELTNDYWTQDSLPSIRKVPKIFCHLKKKIIVGSNILKFNRCEEIL